MLNDQPEEEPLLPILALSFLMLTTTSALGQNIDRTFSGSLRVKKIVIGSYHQESCTFTMRIRSTSNRLQLQEKRTCPTNGSGSSNSFFERQDSTILSGGRVVGSLTANRLQILDGYEESSEAESLFVDYRLRQRRLVVGKHWQSARQLSNRIDLITLEYSGTLSEVTEPGFR